MKTSSDAFAARIGDVLRQRKWKLAVAESVTGGRVQAALTAHSGASDFFVGGVTAYDLKRKVTILGVNASHASSCDCVSPLVAEQMARGVAERFLSEVAIATTGYAEPDARRGVSVPFVFVAVWIMAEPSEGSETISVCRVEGVATRLGSLELYTNAALDRLWATLEGLPA